MVGDAPCVAVAVKLENDDRACNSTEVGVLTPALALDSTNGIDVLTASLVELVDSTITVVALVGVGTATNVVKKELISEPSSVAVAELNCTPETVLRMVLDITIGVEAGAARVLESIAELVCTTAAGLASGVCVSMIGMVLDITVVWWVEVGATRLLEESITEFDCPNARVLASGVCSTLLDISGTKADAAVELDGRAVVSGTTSVGVINPKLLVSTTFTLVCATAIGVLRASGALENEVCEGISDICEDALLKDTELVSDETTAVAKARLSERDSTAARTVVGCGNESDVGCGATSDVGCGTALEVGCGTTSDWLWE